MQPSLDSHPSDRARPPLGRRELLVALLVALAFFAWPVRHGLLSGDRVTFGVDTATGALPWRAAAPPAREGERRPRNPALYDQGHVFYPYYLWVARSWLAGDPPAWNPKVYAGAPGIANPQSGAVDPQVAPLVAAYAAGGRPAFDRALSVMAWLRLAGAGLGAYLLARALGLLRTPAAFAGLTFGMSGYVLLWLNHSLGHVTPLLPWVLLGLERVRGARPWRAAAGTAVAMALAILGGHPETAFYVGATAGLWALALLAEDRRAGALGLGALALGTAAAAVSLVPFVEYLGLSGAKAIRDASLAPAGVDLAALGAVAVAAGTCAWFARIVGAPGEPRHRALAAVGVALAIGGMALLLRGLAPTAALVLLPDLFGAPGSGGYRGEDSYLEAASGWVALAALGLALAAALAPGDRWGALRRRRVIVGVGLVALLLAIEAPGVIDLYRHLPLVGLGATERFAAASALMLALLGAEALQAAPRASRLAAALTLALLAGGALRPDASAPPPEPVALAEEELFGMLLVPPAELSAETLALEGWVHPAVPVTRAALSVQRLDERGRPDPSACFLAPLDLFDAPSDRARRGAADALARAPEGARFFRPSYVSFAWFTEGDWRFAIDLFTAESGERTVGTRVVALSRVARPSGARATTLVLGAAALLLIALLPARPGARWQLAVVAVALLQCAHFARGLNPAVPRAECFPPTRTEEVLAEILGPHRFFADPQVLMPSTGLVRDLAALDGYDGMDVASYNQFRGLCLPPGTNALLGWHARAVDLDNPAFRLLGVGALVLAAPLDRSVAARGWELVAGPGAPRDAECWIYRATDPLPRAFCVPAVVTPDELRPLFESGAWDPFQVAAVDDAWRPARPFTRAEVSTPVWTNNTVTLEAELDGDGLLIVTEQAFPGWRAYVDGEEREVLTANAIFRGVPLAAGRHAVELRYEPRSLRIGALVSVLAAGGVLVLLALDLRGRR